ncbi:amino acid ABC transporter substrate-binding protein [Paracoccus sp. 12-3]|nr:amino acid ABC transporter substrate-binding protein [Paracoccus xiamenensis]
MSAAAWLCLAAAPALAKCENIPSGLDAPPPPQNTGRDIVGQELDQIFDQGYMTFGVYEDFPPFSFLKDGAPAGIDVDLGQIIAAEMGLEARFELVQAGENVDNDMRTYLWQHSKLGAPIVNVLMHVPYNIDFACRNEMVVITGQYFEERIAIAYDPAIYPDTPPTPAYFRFDKVAVENDSISDFFLSGAFGGQVRPNIVHVPDPVAAVGEIGQDGVAAAMGPRVQLEYAAGSEYPVSAEPIPGFSMGSWTLGVAVHQAYRDLAYSVDDAIGAAIADGRMAKIFADYGATYTEPER